MTSVLLNPNPEFVSKIPIVEAPTANGVGSMAMLKELASVDVIIMLEGSTMNSFEEENVTSAVVKPVVLSDVRDTGMFMGPL